MPQFPMVRWAALLWGFATFWPVGLNYTAFVALVAAMLWQGDLRARFEQLRQQPNWWPSLLFLGWGGLILLLGPRYAETASNALHALRIVLMLWLVLALTAEEAVWAVRGFVLGLVVSLLLVGLHLLVGLPPSLVWDSIVRYGGNKSLANAVLMALAAVSGLLVAPWLTGRARVAAIALSLGALGVLLTTLYSRTAWLIVLVAAAAGVLHQLRAQRQRQLLALAVAVALTLSIGLLTPGVKDRLVLGVDEIVSAHQGEAVGIGSSWGIRYRLYEKTLDMIHERPLTGWGIGAWNDQWRQRVDATLAVSNMPHNDFLWMGAQAGVPGALLLLLMVAAGLPRAWQRHDLSGRLGVVALLTLLVALATNSALRDASIGLALWFVVLVWQRLSTEPSERWTQALAAPRRDAALA
ncbi:O-antigen ligase family protein [Ottowia beijingensis]|uniref:O-antigen ligase family protein n=1 Tax=Ottowia beijingensis TaxID=1207057 RepID=UPI00362D79B2